jgi:tetratricopeptide (TPR) repeat protein
LGTDLERDLADIRREVIEGRNLVIRTDNLLKTLHSEVKAFGARQKEFERRQMMSSAAAYALFALLAGTAAVLLSGARASAGNGERDKAVADLKTLTQSIEKERGDQAAVAAARRSAADAYRMMTELPGDRRLEGITALTKVDQSKLDSLERQALADRAAALKRELGQTAFERGKAAFRRNEWAAATEDLSRFLAMQPTEPEQLEASFMLGNALIQQRKYEPAIAPLKTFVDKDRRSKNREWAMTLLAQAYEQTGKPDQAAAVAREALGMYPASQFTPMLKARLSAAKRAISGDGSDAGVTTGPTGDAAPPTATTVTPAAAPAQATAAAPAVQGDGGAPGARARPAVFKTAAESSALRPRPRGAASPRSPLSHVPGALGAGGARGVPGARLPARWVDRCRVARAAAPRSTRGTRARGPAGSPARRRPRRAAALMPSGWRAGPAPPGGAQLPGWTRRTGGPGEALPQSSTSRTSAASAVTRGGRPCAGPVSRMLAPGETPLSRSLARGLAAGRRMRTSRLVRHTLAEQERAVPNLHHRMVDATRAW